MPCCCWQPAATSSTTGFRLEPFWDDATNLARDPFRSTPPARLVVDGLWHFWSHDRAVRSSGHELDGLARCRRTPVAIHTRRGQAAPHSVGVANLTRVPGRGQLGPAEHSQNELRPQLTGLYRVVRHALRRQSRSMGRRWYDRSARFPFLGRTESRRQLVQRQRKTQSRDDLGFLRSVRSR